MYNEFRGYAKMKKILLVEDEPKIAKAIERGLKNEGFDVEVANDGGDGLYLALNFEFDCMILDRMLPEVEGVEICKKVRSAGI